ncbi:hypothetical protein PM082_011825 [Marasmius tenuissimus]|nr:hypothetical protein PM082_011825 [Marasmius tenuissimus]
MLYDLQNVDLAFAFWCQTSINGSAVWDRTFQKLVPWVQKYQEATDCANAGQKTEELDHKCSSHEEVEAHCQEIDEVTCMVEVLVHRFENHPRLFHLEWPPGVSPPDNAVQQIARQVCCVGISELDAFRASISSSHLPRLTDCRCPSDGNVSRDPGHVAWQEAYVVHQEDCMRLFRVYVSSFEELAQDTKTEQWEKEEDEEMEKAKESVRREMGWILVKVLGSSLLEHCRLNTELLLLCQTFFDLAKGSGFLRVYSSNGDKGKRNLLKWIATFPAKFTDKQDALRRQILALPWEQWAQNQVKALRRYLINNSQIEEDVYGGF